MRRMLQRVLAGFMAFAVTLGGISVTFPATVEAETESGADSDTDASVIDSGTEDAISWVLTSDGVLTISGTGEMSKEWYSYEYADFVTSVVIEEGITGIAYSEYYVYWDNVTSLSIPASMESLDGMVAFQWPSWVEINVDEGNSKYSSVDGVLYNKDMTVLLRAPLGITEVEIADTVTEIGENAFYNCEYLESIDLPDGLLVIGAGAFVHCYADLTLPSTLTTIGNSAFYESGCLTGDITIPASVTCIEDYAFLYCFGITSIVIEGDITQIGAGTFAHIGSLTSINIPETVTSIDEWAFEASGYANDSGFTVTFEGDAPEMAEDIFSGCTVTAYYPRGNSTWTSDAMQDYWANSISWVSYGDGAIDISGATVKLGTTSYTYNGSAKKPKVTVTCNGSTLTSGTDYTVSYSNNKNAGTAIVTVTGTGNYAGTATATFTINKASQTITVKSKGSTSIKAGKTTTWTAKTSGNGAITYSTTASSSVGTVNSSTGKVTAKGVGTIKVYAKAAATSNYKASSKTLIATIAVGLTTPTISSVSQSKFTVTVKWAKITGAKGYYVYRSTSKSSGYSKVATITSGSTVSYKDTDSKTNGKTYYYKVYAYSGNTKSSASSVKSIKYMKGTVASLTNTSNGITVKWSKVSGATGYYVYRKASTASSYTLVKTITSNSTVSYSDTGVKSKNGTTYTYYVQPYNSTSKGAYATMKTVRLATASISSLKNSSSKKLTVKWAKNTKATGYEIQYSTSSSFSSSATKKVTVSSAATASKTIGSLTKSKTYYVRVRSYKKISSTYYYSAWSSKKSVKISK